MLGGASGKRVYRWGRKEGRGEIGVMEKGKGRGKRERGVEGEGRGGREREERGGKGERERRGWIKEGWKGVEERREGSGRDFTILINDGRPVRKE